MEKISALFLLLVLCSTSNAQMENLKIGYQEFPTIVTGHASDSAGNMYYSGHYKGELKVNGEILQTGEGLEDIFLVKKDAAGKTIFSKSFGSKNADLTLSNALSYSNNNLYLGIQIGVAVTFQSINVTPSSGSEGNRSSNCIVNFDTAGNVKWVSKTSVSISKIYASNNIIHVIGQTSLRPVLLNDKVVYDNPRRSIIHLMLDTSGNLLNYKLITPRIAEEHFQSPLYLASYGNGNLSLLVSIYGSSSFQFGEKTISLPDHTGIYYVLIKSDTSYSEVSYKVLNPPGLNFYNTNGPGLTIHLSKQDSIYLMQSMMD